MQRAGGQRPSVVSENPLHADSDEELDSEEAAALQLALALSLRDSEEAEALVRSSSTASRDDGSSAVARASRRLSQGLRRISRSLRRSQTLSNPGSGRNSGKGERSPSQETPEKEQDGEEDETVEPQNEDEARVIELIRTESGIRRRKGAAGVVVDEVEEDEDDEAFTTAGMTKEDREKMATSRSKKSRKGVIDEKPKLLMARRSLVGSMTDRMRKLKMLDRPSRVREKIEHPTWAIDSKMLSTQGNAFELPRDSFRAELSRLPQYIEMVMSSNRAEQLGGVRSIRKLLSIERSPPIDAVIETGVTSRLVAFLDVPDMEIAFESCWALTNIASGTSEQTVAVVNEGALPKLIRLISDSPHESVRDQAVWAIGNIAGDSVQMRDLVLRLNVVQPLLLQIHPGQVLSSLRNAVWAISNCCRGKPSPPFESIAPFLPRLAPLLRHSDAEVLSDTLWSFSYISSNEPEEIINLGVVPRLVEIVGMSNIIIATPALRTVGNLVVANDEYTQKVVDAGVVSALKALLNGSRPGIRKESCWALSNITAGTRDQIQAVIDQQVVPLVIHIIRTDSFSVKKEGIWVISNAAAGGDEAQVQHLLDEGSVQVFYDALVGTEENSIRVVMLEGLESMMGKVPSAISQLLECEPWDLFEEFLLDNALQPTTSRVLDVLRGAESL